jgi:hypothetical protein
MNPYYRTTLHLCRLVAAGFIVVTFLNFAAYWAKSRHDSFAMSAGHCLLLSIPLVIGAALLILSPGLARRISDRLDE